MKLYRYWASAERSINDPRGKNKKNLIIKKWGGSNVSQEDAAQIAAAALDKVIAKINAEGIKQSAWTRDACYSYDVRDIPEEIIGDCDGRRGVTRNRVGCVVMNITDAMFVDIDKKFQKGFVGKLFGNTEEKFLTGFEAWLKKHPDMGARVYRTAGGLRYLFTHAPVAINDQSLAWQSEMNADPLYIKLCKTQQCYRARLSPKPYRIGLKKPVNQYPRVTGPQQQEFGTWLATYNNKSQSFAVCQFVKAFGNQRVHSDLAAIVQEHDRATKATSNLPLA
jgi:hypothetical protein